MNIDWYMFTPWKALIGGSLIGLSACLLILLNGRILGISGILANLLKIKSPDQKWRISFIIGVLITPWLYAFWIGKLPTVVINSSLIHLSLAGILVGIGSQLGSGCTSGHGICGLARLSYRSLIATVCFITTAIFTVLILNYI